MIAPGVRGAVAVVLAWICLTGAGLAQALTFPALSGRVVDEAGLLTAADRAALTDSLAGVEAKTARTSLSSSRWRRYGGRRSPITAISSVDTGRLAGRKGQRRAPDRRAQRAPGTASRWVTAWKARSPTRSRRSSSRLRYCHNYRAGDFPGGIKIGVEHITQVLMGKPDDLRALGCTRISCRSHAADSRCIGCADHCRGCGCGRRVHLLQYRRGRHLPVHSADPVRGDAFRRQPIIPGKLPWSSGGGGSFGGGGSSGRW